MNSVVGSYPDSVAVGDFNGDGKADLAVAMFSANSVTVLLGNGDGTFQTPAFSYAAGNVAQSVAVGDFNGVGREVLDVANDRRNIRGVLVGAVTVPTQLLTSSYGA